MRFGVGVGVALLLCGPGSAWAADEAGSKAAAEAVKVASVGEPSGGKANEQSAVSDVETTEPVTRTSAPVKPRKVHSSPTLVARIDLNSQQMRVTSNGKLVGNWSISSGKYNYETPAGRFRPKWTSKMHYSRKYNNSPMPYSVFFNGGIATHGTSYTGRLGAPASHGCIRLRTKNARRFYNLVHQHGYKRTRIVVTGKADVRRVASASRKRTQSRSNSFARSNTRWGQNPYWTSGPRRSSVRQYDNARFARHRDRVRRYYQSRRMVFPGDRR